MLIHLDDAAYTSQFELLDQKPVSYSNFADATLGAGSSWTTPDGYTFAVTAVSAAGAGKASRHTRDSSAAICFLISPPNSLRGAAVLRDWPWGEAYHGTLRNGILFLYALA